MRVSKLLLFFCLMSFLSNASYSQVEVVSKQAVDSSKVLKIGNYVVSPKSEFEYIAVVKAANDTLTFIACSQYLCSPFGRLFKASDIKKSSLKDWHITKVSKVNTMALGKSTTLSLTHEKNKLQLMFCDYTTSRRYSYINNGLILSDDVALMKGVRIGMNSKLFWEAFFNKFPLELQYKYKVIVFNACVDNIPQHTYLFKNHRLADISFN